MLYDYECNDCKIMFQEFTSVAERNNVNCSSCGKPAQKLISQVGMSVDSKMKDSSGQPVWFPKDGASYYDKALQKQFYSKKQKCDYLKENNLVMDGSSDLKRQPIEAGDNRFTKVR